MGLTAAQYLLLLKGFSPLKLSGCTTWLESTLGLTASDGVLRWLDLSGSSNHVTQDTSAKRPTRSGTALEFDATNADTLVGTALTTATNGYTVGVAGQFTALSGAGSEPWFHNGTSTNGWKVGAHGGPWALEHYGVGLATWSAGDTDPHAMVWRHDGAGGNADLAIDGSHQTTKALATDVAATTQCQVGCYVTGAFVSDSRIWGVIVYSDRKSDAVVAKINAYLTALRNGAAPPDSWRPTDEANLVLWLERADRYAGPSATDWADQSGSGRDVTQAATAQQPAIIPYDPIICRPFLHFDGVDDYLRGVWVQAQPVHRFVVGVISRSATGNLSIIDGTAVNSCRLYTTTGTDTRAYAGVTQLIDAGAAANTWQRIEGGFSGAGTDRLRVGDRTPVTGNAGANAPNGLTAGANGVPAGSADASIAEIIEYNRILTTAEQTQLHDYLREKYRV